MANRKISEFTALTAPVSSDVFAVLDVSASGAEVNKKITYANVLSKAPDGSAGSPAFSFSSDTNSGISGGSDTLVFSTAGTARLTILNAGLVLEGNLDLSSEINLMSGTTNANRYIDSSLGDGEGLHLRSTQGGDLNHENMAIFYRHGASKLFHDNHEVFSTTADGIQTSTASGEGSIYIKGGEGGSSALYFHADEADDNNDQYRIIATDNGSISLQNYASGAWENNLKATGNGSVDIYYDNGNTPKLSTTSYGTLFTGNSKWGDNGKAVFGDSADLMIFHDTSNSFLQHTGTGDLIFYGTAESMRINTSQQVVLIGETSVYSDGTMGKGVLQWGGKNGSRVGAQANQNSTNQTAAIGFSNPNGHCGSIETSGTATIYNTSSDYRLKENQVAISDGITRLKNLKPYCFNFKTAPSETVDGFFAHEVQTVVPQAVTGTKDATTNILYNAEDSEKGNIPSGKNIGDVKETVPVIQGMDPSKLIPLLTAALQEAITKIEVLEIQVASLTG